MIRLAMLNSYGAAGIGCPLLIRFIKAIVALVSF